MRRALSGMTRKQQGQRNEWKAFVFVYGTLRKDSWNHSLLRTARFVGKGRTRKRYALYADAVPYAVKDEALVRIAGELYEIDNSTLVKIDRLERHPGWYRRELVAIVLDDGSDMIAWMYFYPRPKGKPVPSGDFLEEGPGSRSRTIGRQRKPER